MSGAHRTLSAERKRRGLVADLALRRGGLARVHGLVGAPQYNGKVVRLLARDGGRIPADYVKAYYGAMTAAGNMKKDVGMNNK